MNNLIFFRFFLFLLATSSTCIRAETQFSLAPSLMHFDYTEFSTDGSVIDKEIGWLPGIQFQVAQAVNDKLNIELELTYYNGTVDYIGHTQSGIDYNTLTNEEVLRFNLSLLTPILSNTDIYLSTKRHQWDRNIRGGENVPGLFEIYQWWEISAGAKSTFYVKDSQSWIADIAILRTINPTIYVDLSSIDVDPVNLDLGPDTGARLQLMWKISCANQYSYGINAFYEIWDFGISDSKTTSDGLSNFSILEPRSETRHSGVQLQLGFKY